MKTNIVSVVSILSSQMLSLNTDATKYDMVRIKEQEANKIHTLPYTFSAPQFQGVEEKYNVRDFALADALTFVGAEWPDTNPLNTISSYQDAQGTWDI